MQQTLLFFILLLTACSPRYEVKTYYILPTDRHGKACIQECLKEQNICQIKCNEKKERCLEKARNSAKESFSHSIKAYKEDLREYENELKHYYLELESWRRKTEFARLDLKHYRDRCQQNINKYECNRANEIRDSLNHLEYDKPTKPQKPTRPTLASEIRNIQRFCTNDCGCKDRYNSCFSACGGVVRYERFCVENCK